MEYWFIVSFSLGTSFLFFPFFSSSFSPSLSPVAFTHFYPKPALIIVVCSSFPLGVTACPKHSYRVSQSAGLHPWPQSCIAPLKDHLRPLWPTRVELSTALLDARPRTQQNYDFGSIYHFRFLFHFWPVEMLLLFLKLPMNFWVYFYKIYSRRSLYGPN